MTGEPNLNNVKLNWSAAEENCVSKGGHLASVASPSHWQKLKDVIANRDIISDVWLGGTDEVNEGNWSWTDGSKWSVEHWWSIEGNNGYGLNCLRASTYGWFNDPCSDNSYSICSIPTTTTTMA